MIPWFRISYFKNIRKLHCNFLFLSIHDITWKCSWLFKYSANSKSSAINANCLGESAAPSFNSRDAPAATSIQQIVLLLYAAALCNAVWPVYIYDYGYISTMQRSILYMMKMMLIWISFIYLFHYLPYQGWWQVRFRSKTW